MPDNLNELFAAMSAMAKAGAEIAGKEGMVCGMGFIVISSSDPGEIEAALVKRKAEGEAAPVPVSGQIIEGEHSVVMPAVGKRPRKRRTAAAIDRATVARELDMSNGNQLSEGES